MEVMGRHCGYVFTAATTTVFIIVMSICVLNLDHYQLNCLLLSIENRHLDFGDDICFGF